MQVACQVRLCLRGNGFHSVPFSVLITYRWEFAFVFGTFFFLHWLIGISLCLCNLCSSSRSSSLLELHRPVRCHLVLLDTWRDLFRYLKDGLSAPISFYRRFQEFPKTFPSTYLTPNFLAIEYKRQTPPLCFASKPAPDPSRPVHLPFCINILP